MELRRVKSVLWKNKPINPEVVIDYIVSGAEWDHDLSIVLSTISSLPLCVIMSSINPNKIYYTLIY